MPRRPFVLAFAALLACSGCRSGHATPQAGARGAAGGPAAFGAPMRLAASETVPLARILEAPDAYAGKTLRVSGTVTEVCAKKGCWIRLAPQPAADGVFVKFTCPVEGRLVPLEAVGRPAVVEGELTVQQISAADARHYAEDAGKPPEEIAKIVGPQTEISMQAPAAEIDL